MNLTMELVAVYFSDGYFPETPTHQVVWTSIFKHCMQAMKNFYLPVFPIKKYFPPSFIKSNIAIGLSLNGASISCTVILPYSMAMVTSL